MIYSPCLPKKVITMTEYAKPIDITNVPELAALAKRVRDTRQPVPLTQDDEVVAVVQPAPAQPTSAPPTPDELARRQALTAVILERRETRTIAPLTSADLVHQAREEAGLEYDSAH
jgi:hypothetical protein